MITMPMGGDYEIRLRRVKFIKRSYFNDIYVGSVEIISSHIHYINCARDYAFPNIAPGNNFGEYEISGLNTTDIRLNNPFPVVKHGTASLLLPRQLNIAISLIL
jgi:hypothetical protein